MAWDEPRSSKQEASQTSQGSERRRFLRQVVVGAAAAFARACKSSSGPAHETHVAQVPASPAQPAAQGKTRIAILNHSAMLADAITPDLAAVLATLDEGVKYIFGESDAARAWARVCGSQDVVALKVNCISGLMYSHPIVVQAITQRLQEIGVPGENIIVWDRTSGELSRAGYKIRREGVGVWCYGTDGAYDEWIQHRSVSTRLSKILSQIATVLINVPILKDHGGAGVTVAMKNHYGSISNPGAMHSSYCNPACAHINDIPAIRDKTRLVVVDATRALFRNGPGGSPDAVWLAQTLIISQNPVATDTLGMRMIDAKRAEQGMELTEPHAGYIVTAAQIGLGPNNPADMSVLETAVG